MRNLIIEVKKNVAGKWYWKLVASNGETLSVSEDYETKRSCLDTVESLKKYIPNSEVKILED